MELTKIAFGGGCHWCTEAVFQSLIGVEKVEQGWVASNENNKNFSEAVIVQFDTSKIELKTLIEIYLLTHKITSNHSMRKKYRSAIYYFSDKHKLESKLQLRRLQSKFENKIITQVLVFQQFKPSSLEFQDYYKTNPEKPFCKTYIIPKLILLKKDFKEVYKDNINQ